jgi:hypothetical protein
MINTFMSIKIEMLATSSNVIQIVGFASKSLVDGLGFCLLVGLFAVYAKYAHDEASGNEEGGPDNAEIIKIGY